MAGRQYGAIHTKTFDPAVDLSADAKRYTFVKKTTTANYGIDTCGLNERPIGVLQVGSIVGKGSTVALIGAGGGSKLKVGVAVTAGQRLKSDASGRGIPVSGAQEYFAIALETALAGDTLIEALMQTGYAAAVSPSLSKSPSASSSPSASKSPSASASPS